MHSLATFLTLHMIVGAQIPPDTLKDPPLEGWWAICRDPKSQTEDQLAPIKLAFRRKPWEVADGKVWIPKVTGCRSPVVLLRDLPFLTARAVPKAKVVRTLKKDGGRSYAIRHGIERYTLDDSETGPPSNRQHRVRLIGPQRSQNLKDDEYRMRPVELLWAGDLDGDGKLDLLLQVPSHEAATIYRLFLSSAAKGDDLLDWIAEQLNAGC